jgi:hypothetical protein
MRSCSSAVWAPEEQLVSDTCTSLNIEIPFQSIYPRETLAMHTERSGQDFSVLLTTLKTGR